MESASVSNLRPEFEPVAVVWSNTIPADALQFMNGKFGCSYTCPLKHPGAEKLPAENFNIILGVSGHNFVEKDRWYGSDKAFAKTMFQNAVIYGVRHPRFKGQKPTLAFIEEGPYAIPMASS